MPYEDVLRAFSGRKVRYLVAGGVAVNLHGVPRMTMDLDLMVDFAPANARKAVEALTGLGFRPHAPVPMEAFADPGTRESWIRDKHMLVFSVLRPERPWEIVDLFIRPPLPFSRAWERRKRVKLGALVVPVVSMADLIAMKRLAGRPQDLSDIDALIRLEAKKNGGTR